MAQPAIQRWRKQLKEGCTALRAAFEQHQQADKLLRGQCRLVDVILRDIWAQSGLPDDISLIAVGGYGRGELYPHSDVDILILTPEETPAALNTLESVVGILWDIGLSIGHSVRTLPECLEEAQNDITVQTNLLEARWLAGNRCAYRTLQHMVHHALQPEAFFTAKLAEQTLRHRRYNDTSHNLEPNIKESPGGLRDLHMIGWIARSINLRPGWAALTRAGFINSLEARQIRHQEKFLQYLRIQLHYLADRREDRLLFDHQDTLAKQIFSSKPATPLAAAQKPDARHTQRPSEKIMQRYYQSARIIGLMNEVLLGSFRQHIFAGTEANRRHAITPIGNDFQARNGLLETRDKDAFQARPETILQFFIALQAHPELEGANPTTIRQLWQAGKSINRVFRSSPDNQRAFMQILRSSTGIIGTLRRMHRYGILGRYIPAFGKITDQMQHDLFHVYTVDEHTLNVLSNMVGFSMADRAHEFPLCSRLFSEFPQPELLYLAALFHDIGKGRGGDHSTLGAADAHRFCATHGLDKAEIEMVTWLVRNHLVMSATAQRQDISDPNIIADFARSVGDERHLAALYLLTVADIRGTSPAIWNAWKARLLESLFNSTLRHLRSPTHSIADEISARKQSAQTILGHYGIAGKSYLSWWKQLEDSYFLRHEAKEIAWQTRLLLVHADSKKPIVRARLSPDGDGIQIMIYTPDRNDLFARICAFFDRMGYSIVEAKINTSKHGYALDSFLVLDNSDRSIKYGNLIGHIEQGLEAKLSSDTPPDPPLEGRISRQLKHSQLTTHITILPDEKTGHHLLTLIAGDRPGLLSRVAHVLLKHDVRLLSAKINTMGNRAEDTLAIAARNGLDLTENTIQEITRELTAAL